MCPLFEGPPPQGGCAIAARSWSYPVPLAPVSSPSHNTYTFYAQTFCTSAHAWDKLKGDRAKKTLFPPIHTSCVSIHLVKPPCPTQSARRLRDKCAWLLGAHPTSPLSSAPFFTLHTYTLYTTPKPGTSCKATAREICLNHG